MIYTHFKSTKYKNLILFCILIAYMVGLFFSGIPTNIIITKNDIKIALVVFIPFIFNVIIYYKLFGQMVYDFLDELVKK